MLSIITNRKNLTTLKKNQPKLGFAKSVSVLAGGTAAAQLITIVASPILARLYSPEDFGLLAVYGAILAILSVVASLRYELAIPLPRDDRAAACVAILSFGVVTMMTVTTAVAVGLFGSNFADVLSIPSLTSYLWLVPIGVFLIGVYQVLQYWAIRKKEFSAIARTKIIQSIMMTATQVGGFSFGPIALVLGRVVGQSAGIWGLARSALMKDSESFKVISGKEIKAAAVTYKSFPQISTWTGLASSAGLNLTPLLITSFLGLGSAGLFSLAHRVLSQPMAVIGKAVSDAFYQKAAEAHREGGLGKEVEGVYSVLVTLALAPAIITFIIIPDLFTLVFGAEWQAAGAIAQWMTPWLFFQFVVSPCTGIYPIIDRHDIALRFQVGLLASSVFGVVIGAAYFKDLVMTVIFVSGLSSLVYFWRVVTTFKVVGLNRIDAICSTVRGVPTSILISLPVILTHIVLKANVVGLIFASFLSMLIWLVLLVRPLLDYNGGK